MLFTEIANYCYPYTDKHACFRQELSLNGQSPPDFLKTNTATVNHPDGATTFWGESYYKLLGNDEAGAKGFLSHGFFSDGVGLPGWDCRIANL
ncbi:hypothetical protein HF324_12680 [Chitinophaga oryzae]|uniref:Uncharacterized protein n=1 Tax=Chitinophaga oryzae TaxID=2725414 RepID=A0ABX6LEY1_9BACT|nr:hypothetical protein [Chitinophaga oryzae]QJB38674.1 hypothetical protein HF324_12680 [Chitinophaga oryzae]